MPRAARIKDPEAIYHIMSRSITEFDLFPDNSDKEEFLDILKKYAEKYHCKVYAFCLMTNHYHIIIDTCGFDISKFMKSFNQTYVKHINRKYNRRGHLLTERFASKIITNDKYMLTVSAYVHNNPKDISGYAGREYEYTYSSMGIYLGLRKDKRKLVDTDFVLGCVNEINRKRAVERYEEIVRERRGIVINRKLQEYLKQFQDEQYEYRPYRKVIIRDKDPKEIIRMVAGKFGIEDTEKILHRWKRSTMDFRRVVAYVLHAFCGMGIKEVAENMCNITASCCAKLSDRGYEIIRRDNNMKELIGRLCEA
jgi:putative transposase